MLSQKLSKGSVLAVTVSIFILVTGCKNKSAGEQGWHNLFDGKTLTGWKVLNQDFKNPDSKTDFYIENGMIVCNTVMGNEGGGYLITEKPYADFILELDVKIDSSLNSGIQCRGRLWDKDTSSI